MYCFDSRVRYSEVSEDGKLSLTGIMNYMQDCSTFQSEDCGVGVEWLKKKDRAWLLVAWDIHILRRPELGDHITVITKPYYFEGVAGRRLFELRLKEDETLLVRANSLWCYAQPSRQRPVRLTPEDVEPYGIPDSAEGDTEIKRRLIIPEDARKAEPFPIHKEHLDTNHHVNNGQYVNMAYGYLPEGMEPDRIQAEYRKQAHFGDIVFPLVSVSRDKATVGLGNEEGSMYAVISFEKE